MLKTVGGNRTGAVSSGTMTLKELAKFAGAVALLAIFADAAVGHGFLWDDYEGSAGQGPKRSRNALGSAVLVGLVALALLLNREPSWSTASEPASIRQQRTKFSEPFRSASVHLWSSRRVQTKQRGRSDRTRGRRGATYTTQALRCVIPCFPDRFFAFSMMPHAQASLREIN